MLHIFVDADACPVKQEVYRVASRYRLDVTLVANSWMRVPNERRIALEVVEDGFDAADDWIVEHIQPHDIVVTADILLASRCLKEGALVIGPTGRPFTEDNIGEAVATRDQLQARLPIVHLTLYETIFLLIGVTLVVMFVVSTIKQAAELAAIEGI